MIVTYVYNKIDEPKVLRATIIGALALSNVLRLPILAYGEILTVEILKRTLVIFPAFLFSLYLGHKLYGKISDKVFRKLCLVLLLLAGILLVLR